MGLRVCPHTIGHRAAWGDTAALCPAVARRQRIRLGPEPDEPGRPGPQGHSPSGETEALRPGAVMLGPAGEPVSR